MPKKVDHQERRERIAAALMRVAADRGLEAVSLRHVAAEAGVTAGMVQHYFASKDAMMDFAMQTASARYEVRMTAAVAALGDEPAPRALVEALLRSLLPLEADERADGRVALAFLSYAATKPDAAAHLEESNGHLRDFIAEQIRAAQAAGGAPTVTDAASAAAAAFALAEGLAIHVLSSGLSAEIAAAALTDQLDRVFGSDQSGPS